MDGGSRPSQFLLELSDIDSEPGRLPNGLSRPLQHALEHLHLRARREPGNKPQNDVDKRYDVNKCAKIIRR